MRYLFPIAFSLLTLFNACNNGENPSVEFSSTLLLVDGKIASAGDTLETENISPIIKIGLPIGIDTSSVKTSVSVTDMLDAIPSSYTYSFTDGFLILNPILTHGRSYRLLVNNQLRGVNGEIFSSLELTITTQTGSLNLNELLVDSKSLLAFTRVGNIQLNPTFHFQFSAPVDNTIADHLKIFNNQKNYSFNLSLSEDQKELDVSLNEPLTSLKKHTIEIIEGYSFEGLELSALKKTFYAKVDSTLKFPEISDEELLTKVQSQTFNYFYDHAGIQSGMARERNNSGNVVTSGGSGFGIMSLIVGMERGFITKDQGLERIEKILTFLEKADRFHGAYSHWIDDVSGDAIAFSTKDNGGDLVETSFLFQGLITYRQYMDGNVLRESAIIDRINTLWSEVEWDWYTQGGQNVLYWHWSPNFNFEMNFALRGYYEATVTYVLAASSSTHTIDKVTYEQGWMRSGGVVNGKQFFGITLPLGYDYGGPLFFAHYSFLGLDPRKLEDNYANYWEQNVAHSLINYEHCIRNPRGHIGYNGEAWGLTASDEPTGYGVHEPTDDNGTISPTAALSSFPYTPDESMKALRYFYYILGDKLWSEYGFYDAYNVNEGWWANSTLAIDQGPIIIMIENYRTGLLWDLFMSAPEIQAGLNKLEITYE
jgi:hypothetical protein